MSKLKLWIVEAVDVEGRDTLRKIVVITSSRKRARQMAADNARDEGKYVWLDRFLSTCQELTPGFIGEEVIIKETLDE